MPASTAYPRGLVAVVSQPFSLSLLTRTIILVADTRTDKPLMLGHALLQHQHIGILPTSGHPPRILPLQDPSTSTTMPEAWVRSVVSTLNDHPIANDATLQGCNTD